MVLDWIIMIVMLAGLIGGIVKGVIQQIFSLGGLILGIIVGTLLYEPFATLLLSIFRMSDQTARIVAPQADPTVDERLIEMDYGQYEGTDLTQLPPCKRPYAAT